MLKRQIGHQRTDDTLYFTVPRPTLDNRMEQLISVIELASGIDHLDSIRIAVQGHAEVCPVDENGVAQRLG